MTGTTTPRGRLFLVFAGLTFVQLLGCSRPPDAPTVQAIIASQVKMTLEPRLGPLKVTVEKFQFGQSFARTNLHGKARTYFPCKATYSTVDARGNATRDAVWLGNFALDERNKWIVESAPTVAR